MHYSREPRAIFDTIGAQSPTERGAFLPTGRVNDIGCEAAVPPLECLASWSRIPGSNGGTLRILGSTGLTSRVELILTKALLQLARDRCQGHQDY